MPTRGTTGFDRFALYELCVQDPPALAALLAAIHGAAPRVLGEDFCGTAALSRAWVELIPGGRALAVDRDAEALGRIAPHPAIRAVAGDVIEATQPAATHAVDLLHAGNFSLGYWHARSDLVGYLRHARARLNPGGIFVGDLYGGAGALALGTQRQDHPLPGGGRVTYVWDQQHADPITARVRNAIHFELRSGDGATVQRLRDAFVYDWRLWGLPELRDALAEAGFARSAVYARRPQAVDDRGDVHAHPLEADDLGETFDVLVVGR